MTATDQAQVVFAGAVVRVWSPTHGVVGGGFLVGSGWMATCAHVVAEALGIDPYAVAAPTAAVSVDFPLLDGEDGEPSRAVAKVERWTPIRDDGSGDLALLRLVGPLPSAARMPPVRRIERLWDHRFEVLGFPEGRADGVRSTGLIRGEQGTRWFQLQSTPGEPRIEGGFSGAPVWEVESGAVVGMTVAAVQGETTTAYLIPIDQVLGQDPDLVPCPYRGLRPFSEEQAGAFHGRDEEIQRLLGAVERLPVVAVVGPSGAGKSSLVKAGLLPRLRASGARIVDVRARSVREAEEALDTTLDPRLDPPASARESDPRPGVVLVLDQFEELVEADPTGARELLERIVAEGSVRSVRAVLTLRWAAMDELLSPTLVDTLATGTVLVAPLDRARLREAIVRPAERAPGLAFEEGLVERILDDAGIEPGQLPLVGSLLSELWERRERGYLTLAGYEAAGGVAGSVAQHAEKVVGSVPIVHEDRLRQLFCVLARPDQDGRFVRRPVSLGQLSMELRAVVPALVDGRLLVVSGSGAGAVLELAHQALIECWPRLRDWLAQDSEFLAWRSWLEIQRKRWEAERRDDAALLRGATLAAAGEWLPAREADLPVGDLDYLRRSTARQRREVRRWRLVTAVLTILVLAAGALALIALQRRHTLAVELAAANANVLGSEARNWLPSDPVLAAQLALAAWRSDPRSPQARGALGSAYLAMRSVDAVVAGVSDGPITDMLVSGDSVIVKRDPGLAAIDMAGGRPATWQIPDSAPSVESTLAWSRAVSRDGRWLADVAADGSVRVRDLVARGAPRALPRTGAGFVPAMGIVYPRFSADGTRLAWAAVGPDHTIYVVIRDVRSGAAVPTSIGPMPRGAISVWPTPDPNLVILREGILSAATTRLVVRSLDDGAVVATMPPGSEVAQDGSSVVSCEPATNPSDAASTSTVVVTPVGSPVAPRRITVAAPNCAAVQLSVDRHWLVEDRLDNRTPGRTTLRLTDLATGGVRTAEAAGMYDSPVLTKYAFSVAATVAVSSAGGRVSVLLGRGTSLQLLATEPTSAVPLRGTNFWLDAATVLNVGSSNSMAVRERGTGRQLAGLPVGVESLAEFDQHALWTVTPQAGNWELKHYELPSLRPLGGFQVPAQRPGGLASPDGHVWGIAVSAQPLEQEGRLLVLDNGWISTWDRTSGRRASGPVRIATKAEDEDKPVTWARMWSRPNHPGQVALLAPDMSVQLWDVGAGRLLHTMPTKVAARFLSDPSDVVFDLSGERMAVLNANKTIEVWNADTGELSRPPIPAPTTDNLIGFDPDGYLDVLNRVGLDNPSWIAFVDTDAGTEAGSLTPSGNATMAGDRRSIVLGGSGDLLPREISATARAWHDTLCASANRAFTPAELALLPPGADTDPPC